MSRVLIIKTGESESFAESKLPGISLGDVLRSTVLLHLFEKDEVTWITSSKAFPLLASNPRIQVLQEENFNETSIKRFDVVLNLEKTSRWIALLQRQPVSSRFGFADEKGLSLKRQVTWQQGLFALMGKTWQGEEYVYVNPKIAAVPPVFDVGLNWQCGPKWPSKKWDDENWRELHQRLSPQYRISWQQGFDCLEEYAAWIQSCRSLITVDSLGLHLALALRKKVLALFGPTSPEQIHLYGRGLALSPSPEEFPCAPCFDSLCSRKISCMSRLSVNNAETTFKHLYSGGLSS